MDSSNSKRAPIRISISCPQYRPDKRQRTAEKILPSSHHELEERDSSFPAIDESHPCIESFPNDIIMAIQSLAIKQSVMYYPRLLPSIESCHNLLPFILKPMLHHVFRCETSDPARNFQNENKYHAANANTGVNIEWQRACHGNLVRGLVLLGTSDSDETRTKVEDDIAVMETELYIEAIWDAFQFSWGSTKYDKQNNQRNKMAWSKDQSSKVIQWFIDQLNVWTRSYVTYHDLDQAIQKAQRITEINSSAVVGLPLGSTTRMIVDYLLSIGLLLPRTGPDRNCFWFSLPNLGSLSKALTVSRKLFLAHIKRSYYKEVKMSTLANKRFGDKNFSLPGNFLVLDFVSRGVVKICKTPSGDFVRLI